MSTNDTSEGTIPVDQAKQMVVNWQSYIATSGQKFNVRSYLVPIAAYKNLLINNPDAENVRVYIGLNDATNPATSQILLVPIVNGDEKLNRETGESNVYDTTVPCPPVCPTPPTPPAGNLES
ncbi:hypothetical protein [Mucilaginibacter sp. dw_454]|uniref:hypothetical protein n=1 Tax=Mucilaginibacter sp. dw_454 TaxID=2720079 RepID=UPI001BD435D6|nr:hypothetical protein [Mucilaginibacter sp. dw_454]